MIKKVLFLYTNSQKKKSLALCKPVFKAIFRKFRVSPLFNSMQIDLSPTCRSLLRELFNKEFPKYDAIFLFSDKESSADEEIFFIEIFQASVVEYHAAGKVICTPIPYVNFIEKDDSYTESITFSSEAVDKAVETAYFLAEKRQHRISVVSPISEELDKIFLHKFEESSVRNPHISTEVNSLNETIFLCSTTFPSFDVILSSFNEAKILTFLLGTVKNIPSDYLVYHTNSRNLYCKRHVPFEELGNDMCISDIMAFSALLEGIGMKSAALWLKRCVTLVYNQSSALSESEFTDRVICEIKKPIRAARYKNEH